jgi:type 1 glutamine amidotransferase
MTRVLVLGENTFPFHAIDEKRAAFESVFEGFDLTVTDDRDALTGDYDVLVDYLTDSTLTDAQLSALLDHVERGGGYLGVHCATDLTSRAPGPDSDEVIVHEDEPLPELRDLVGGHFLGHPERSEFGVAVTADHPITDGVADFSVFDEPYRLDVDDGVTVLARMDHPDLDDYPVVWTNDSRGRVAYVSLGHTDEAFEHEAVRRLLRNAVDWADA